MPKPAGVTFNRYAAIAGRILRKSLKEDKRINAQRVDTFDLKVSKWENGSQGEPKALATSLKN